MDIKPITLADLIMNSPNEPEIEMDGYMITPESSEKLIKWMWDNTPQYIKDLEEDEG